MVIELKSIVLVRMPDTTINRTVLKGPVQTSHFKWTYGIRNLHSKH